MNDTAELMQRTIPLTWNSPEWMLPEAKTDLEKDYNFVIVLIARGIKVFQGGYSTRSMRFFDHDSEPIDTQDIDFWAYMPKHPNK